MNSIFILLIVLISISVVVVQAQTQVQVTDFDPDFDDDLETSADSSQDNQTALPQQDVITSLLTAVLNSENFQSKLQKLYNLLDLKVRFIKLVSLLVTRENFILLRRVLDFVARSCNFIIQFLPESPQTTTSGFLDTLFPIINLAAGSMPIPDDDNSEEETSRLSIVTTPTTTTTTTTSIDSNEIINVGSIRVAKDVKLTDEEKELLKNYQKDAVQVAQLIYDTRKK